MFLISDIVNLPDKHVYQGCGSYIARMTPASIRIVGNYITKSSSERLKEQKEMEKPTCY